MKNHAFIAATTYARAGLSVIPIWANGTKALALKTGERKPFEKVIATDDILAKWFNRSQPFAVGILGGEVSGNLECIDFDVDANSIFPIFSELVNEKNESLMGRLTINKTPRPGYHVVYRVSNTTICGSKILAKKTTVVDGRLNYETTIETRGQGGYFIAPGSPKSASPYKNDLVWQHYSGPKLSRVPIITSDERELLWNIAKSLDRAEKTIPINQHNKLRPGDDFNLRGPDIAEIVRPHGWTTVDGINWRRPNKETGGSSATWGSSVGKKSGLPLFHPFSQNCHPLEAGKNYDKFTLYAALNYHGDLSAAAKALAAIGYGEQPKPKQQPQQKRRLSPVAEAAIKLIESLPENELNEVVMMFEAQLEGRVIGG